MTDPLGRVAFRREGNMWNAYYAKPDTMDGAILLGSIRIINLDGNTRRRQVFSNLMRMVAEDLAGIHFAWSGGPETAPEHERAGNS